MAQEQMTFRALASNDFKTLVVKISKVMTEVWLYQRKPDGTKYPDGKAFLDGLNQGKTIAEILKGLGIQLPSDDENFIKPVLNTTSIDGGIIVDPSVEDSATKSIRFLWSIPFFPDPTEQAVATSTLEDWVKTCNKWLKQPSAKLPVPKSFYIPLSTS